MLEKSSTSYLGAEYREFESRHSDHLKRLCYFTKLVVFYIITNFVSAAGNRPICPSPVFVVPCINQYLISNFKQEPRLRTVSAT